MLQTLARSSTKDTTIPTFPVEEARLGAVRERVNAARKLDKMLLHNRSIFYQCSCLQNLSCQFHHV